MQNRCDVMSRRFLCPYGRFFRFVEPKSVISVMMIMDFIFEQMFWHFEGAMGFHCNREATKQMTKRRLR